MDTEWASTLGSIKKPMSVGPRQKSLAGHGVDVPHHTNHEAESSERSKISDSDRQNEEKGSTCNPGQEKQVQSWTLCCPRDCSRDAE